MPGGLPVGGRGRDQSGIQRVFRRPLAQFWSDGFDLPVVASVDEFDESLVKAACLRMKTARSIRRQPVAHVAAGDEGNAARQSRRGGGDGFAQRNESVGLGIIEA